MKGAFVREAAVGAIVVGRDPHNSASAHAQSVNMLDQIVDQFQSAICRMGRCTPVFCSWDIWHLAGIELAWAAFDLPSVGRT